MSSKPLLQLEKRTIKEEVVHSRKVGLSLATNEADTLVFATVTWLCFMTRQAHHTLVWGCTSSTTKHEPITIDVVVERQFLVLLDESARKDAHAHVPSDGPFGHITIRIAAVVCEPPDTTAFGRVDELK